MLYGKIIIDVSNVYYKSFYAIKEESVKLEDKEIATNGIYGFLRSLNKLMRDYGTDKTEYYFCFDNFASQDSFRKNLDPDYKLDRKKYSDSFYLGINYLALILLNYSNTFYNVQCPNLEADDLPPTLISMFDKHDRILIISEDFDFSRNINTNVDWLSHSEIISKEKFYEKYKFYPTKEKITLMRVIRGDHSDNIEIGIKGIKEDLILKLIEDYKDIYDLLNSLHKIEYLNEHWKQEFIKNKARLILNHQLIDFIDISQEELKSFIFKGEFNPKTLRYFYKALKFQISDIDKRLLNTFPDKEEIENKDFFSFDKIKRK